MVFEGTQKIWPVILFGSGRCEQTSGRCGEHAYIANEMSEFLRMVEKHVTVPRW